MVFHEPEFVPMKEARSSVARQSQLRVYQAHSGAHRGIFAGQFRFLPPCLIMAWAPGRRAAALGVVRPFAEGYSVVRHVRGGVVGGRRQ